MDTGWWPYSGADPGFRKGGGQSWRALCAAGKILLINIHFSLKPIYFIAQTSAELSTTRYASPFAYAICMQAKVSAVRDHCTVESSITGQIKERYTHDNRITQRFHQSVGAINWQQIKLWQLACALLHMRMCVKVIATPGRASCNWSRRSLMTSST